MHMSQTRQTMMLGTKNTTQFGDTRFTKVFVGGLAWETQTESMKHYFEQFGEILEAVVITDKNTGRSKGYGFVTFKNPDSAIKACQNSFPVIDGRKANCNLAYLGAQRNHPTSPQHVAGVDQKLRPNPAPRSMVPRSGNFHQSFPLYAFPYVAYGYPGHPQNIYAMNYYNAYGAQGQHFPLHYYNYYPRQYPKMMQYPYFSQQNGVFGMSSLPAPASHSLAASGPATGAQNTASEQNSSG